VACIFWATYIHGEGYALILTKMAWAAFWAIFSQANLVTLNSGFESLQGVMLFGENMRCNAAV
jgi:hypothetical protein